MKVLKKIFTLFLFAPICLPSCESYRIETFQSQNKLVDSSSILTDFKEIQFDKYKDSLDKEMSEILNECVVDLEVGCPEGLLGNFICDLSLFMTNKYYETNIKPDFCVLNNGGFRSSLNKGMVTRGKIFEIMPFDNYLVILKLDENQMEELLNYIKEKSSMGMSRKSGVPVSGLRMKISENKITRCMINNSAFNSNQTYYVLTTDYLAKGGDNMGFFKDATEYINTGVLLRDAIISYISEINKTGIKVEAKYDGRIQING